MNLQFPNVTLLIAHYNRSKSLERLLASFRDLGFKFGDIVVSDDGSKPEHQEYIKGLQSTFNFRLITAEKNRGLGNNNNKGQDAVKTPLTLYVQEDFDPTQKFPQAFTDGVSMLSEYPDIDLVRFYAYEVHPYLKPFKYDYNEMLFGVFKWHLHKMWLYSDHPHLRRSNFFSKFGRYPEGLKVEETEYRMMISFLKNKGKAVIYKDIRALFDQKNSQAEPSTVRRNVWRNSGNPLISLTRHLYRHAKFNYYYLFKKV